MNSGSLTTEIYKKTTGFMLTFNETWQKGKVQMHSLQSTVSWDTQQEMFRELIYSWVLRVSET